MAYQGTADLKQMASDLSDTIICGHWSDAIAAISKLNALQAVCICDELRYLLSQGQMNTLSRLASEKMNEGETGLGYIAENQETEDEPIEAEDWWEDADEPTSTEDCWTE